MAATRPNSILCVHDKPDLSSDCNEVFLKAYFESRVIVVLGLGSFFSFGKM